MKCLAKFYGSRPMASCPTTIAKKFIPKSESGNTISGGLDFLFFDIGSNFDGWPRSSLEAAAEAKARMGCRRLGLILS